MDNQTAAVEEAILSAIRFGVPTHEMAFAVFDRLHPHLANRPKTDPAVIAALDQYARRVATILADYRAWTENRKRHREWVYKINTEKK